MTEPLDLAPPLRVRLRVVVLVGLLHVLAVVGLIRAFAPDLAGRVVEGVVSTFAVPAPSPSPSPTPDPSPVPQAKGGEAAGAAGAAGRKAVPRAVSAPPPRVVIPRPQVAPRIAGTGAADSAGSRDAGEGTGGGNAGSGPGAGGSGTGSGAGGGAGVVKLAGEINSARDYPAASRDKRIGDHVIIALTVGTDGKPTACRVARASRDPDADAITCRLALARFRFKPATNADGEPIVATYGWQQRWFYRNGE